MKKILDNKDLFEQFKNDREVMSQKQLTEKYSISLSSVTRLVSQIKQQSINQSQISKHSEQSKSLDEELESQDEESDSQNEQSVKDISSTKSSKSKEEIQQEEQIINNSLIDYLKESGDQPEIQKIKKEQRIIQQPQPIVKQPIQQIDLPQNPDSDKEIQNLMIKIRKIIQYFKNEPSIFHIIGQTSFQQQQFISNLYKKNLEQIQLLHKTIQFEFMFSRSNDFLENGLETCVEFIEKMLLQGNVNVVGCFQEMKQDPEFDFYFKMMLCDNAYMASAKQIIFLKFVKNYYQKYQQNKQNIMTFDMKEKMKEKIDENLLSKFKNL